MGSQKGFYSKYKNMTLTTHRHTGNLSHSGDQKVVPMRGGQHSKLAGPRKQRTSNYLRLKDAKKEPQSKCTPMRFIWHDKQGNGVSESGSN